MVVLCLEYYIVLAMEISYIPAREGEELNAKYAHTRPPTLSPLVPLELPVLNSSILLLADLLGVGVPDLDPGTFSIRSLEFRRELIADRGADEVREAVRDGPASGSRRYAGRRERAGSCSDMMQQALTDERGGSTVEE